MPRERDKSLIDEQYLLKDFYLRFCRECLTFLASDLGCWRAGNPGTVQDKVSNDLMSGGVFLSKDSNSKKSNWVELRNFRYDKGKGQKIYGKPYEVSKTITNDGRSYTFDRRGYDEDAIISHAFGYKLREKEAETLTQLYKASTAIRTTTKASASVSGGPAKAEASTEVTTDTSFEAAVGVDKLGSMEKEYSDSITQPIIVKAGKRVLASVQKTRLITETPYKVNGIIDCDILIDWENWAGDGPNGALWTSHKARNRFEWHGIEGFLRFLNGYDTRFPRMAKYASVCGRSNGNASKAWDWLLDLENRAIKASGVKRRTYEDNADVIVSNLAD